MSVHKTEVYCLRKYGWMSRQVCLGIRVTRCPGLTGTVGTIVWFGGGGGSVPGRARWAVSAQDRLSSQGRGAGGTDGAGLGHLVTLLRITLNSSSKCLGGGGGADSFQTQWCYSQEHQQMLGSGSHCSKRVWMDAAACACCSVLRCCRGHDA